MGLLDVFRRTSISTEVATLREQVRIADGNTELMQEDLMARAELALEDEGWLRMSAQSAIEMTRAGRLRSIEVARVMATVNPLIKRGLALRNAYIWGSGVEIGARSKGGDAGQQDVNKVIQRFLDDPQNKRSFSGEQAQEELERAHGTDGDIYLACFTTRATGRVVVRSLPTEEITDVINNPEDSKDPWFYRRDYVHQGLDLSTGTTYSEPRTVYYPALFYSPRMKPRTIDGHPVMWDAPVRHSKVNSLSNWTYGIGDVYAGLRWARNYAVFLDDWATLMKALSRFAWQYKAKRGHQAAKARIAAPATTNGRTAERNDAGATAIVGQDSELTAIPKTGATIDSDSGRPLAAMVAAALDVPVTALLSDPGQTGARAVAETLDEPTKRTMEQRRSLWTSIIQDLCAYVIMQAVRAPRGGLQGSIVYDEYTRSDTVVLAGDTDPTVDVDWPPLDDENVKERIDAIVAADGTGKVPPKLISQMLMLALGVEDIDEWMKELTDEDGNFIDPFMTAAQQAIRDWQRGRDPTAALGGSGGDEEPAAGDPPEEDAVEDDDEEDELVPAT